MTTRAMPEPELLPGPPPAPRAAARWATREGAPLPLGATWLEEERAYNFALYSKHAERVTLLLYGERDLAQPLLALELDYREHKSGRVWHCRLAETAIGGARYYAYSVDGPEPAGQFEWHAFDPRKVLLDPYARAVFFPPEFDRAAAMRPGSNAGRAPLGVVRVDGDDGPPPIARPLVHEADAVIYELHVRNLTRHPSSGVDAEGRGTYTGVVEKIPHLRDLGVTIVELMPVFQGDPQGADRWGYMPLSFMAPNGAFASAREPGAQRREFRDMVDALHRAGIEVVLDVVYNHTGEAGAAGPTYSYKGIDNSTYYLMTGRAEEPYADFSGTGNTLHCANRAVRRMILDSMHHWAHEMGVDGFRFDLASIFARATDGRLLYDEAPIVGEIGGHADLAHLRLIAEPWDVGGANQLGRAFPGVTWHQWNGLFRDEVRRFVRGDPGVVPALMRRLYGSDDLFPDDRAHAYRPLQSVNYVSCHDGFTLYDLVSYNHRRRRGGDRGDAGHPTDTYSWNCGWEGDEHVPEHVAALRVRQAKNLVLLVLLANGTPMLRAGDEFLHTQGGDDNPYDRDDETVWLDWRRRETFGEMVRFVGRAIAFRKHHPSLCRSRFWRSDIRWYGVGAAVDLAHDSHSLAYCLRGTSEGDDDLYVMINAWQEALTFDLQEGSTGEWRRAIDTALPSPDDVCEPGREVPLVSMRYTVAPRSIAVCVRRASPRGERRASPSP